MVVVTRVVGGEVTVVETCDGVEVEEREGSVVEVEGRFTPS